MSTQYDSAVPSCSLHYAWSEYIESGEQRRKRNKKNRDANLPSRVANRERAREQKGGRELCANAIPFSQVTRKPGQPPCFPCELVLRSSSRARSLPHPRCTDVHQSFNVYLAYTIYRYIHIYTHMLQFVRRVPVDVFIRAYTILA